MIAFVTKVIEETLRSARDAVKGESRGGGKVYVRALHVCNLRTHTTH